MIESALQFNSSALDGSRDKERYIGSKLLCTPRDDLQCGG